MRISDWSSDVCSSDLVRARAVAGAANNQLATPEAGFILARRGILFAPDYVMNAGGIISGLEATNSMPGRSRVDFPRLGDSLARIHDRLLEIFARAAGEGRPPAVAAEARAGSEERRVGKRGG